MSEHDWEPVRGLPGRLPAGEHILWQGSPDWRVLARTVFHVRMVGMYFLILIAAAIAAQSWTGAAATALAAGLGLGLLAILAFATAQTTIYTLTNRRVVLRIGIAMPKCFNFPLKLVEAADLRPLAGGHGDIALRMQGDGRIGYVFLWPHARPWRLKAPEPMLRAIPDAEAVAARLARACGALAPVALAAPAPAEDAHAGVPVAA
jgi:hypothetical protein